MMSMLDKSGKMEDDVMSKNIVELIEANQLNMIE